MSHLNPHLVHVSAEGEEEVLSPSQETFDIEDFTAASEWEKFVANLEEAIREWGMAGKRGDEEEQEEEEEGGGEEKVWRQDKKAASFMGVEFIVVRHRLVRPDQQKEDEEAEEAEEKKRGEDPGEDEEGRTSDSSSSLPKALKELLVQGRDFPSLSHPVHYFFGLTDFVLLCPRGRSDLTSPSALKSVLSAASVAASDTCCLAPILVQVSAASRAQFAGVFCSPRRFRTDLEMSVLPARRAAMAADCAHLQDLLRVFRERLSRPLAAEVPQGGCTASVRKTYLLEDWAGTYEWTQSPPDMDLFAAFGPAGAGGDSDIGQLPLGSAADPVKRLVVNADWPRVNEALVVENNVHSDFDPRDAPKWSVGVTLDDHPDNLLGAFSSTPSFFLPQSWKVQIMQVCTTGEYLKEFSALCRHHETMREVLGDLYSERSSSHEDSAAPTAGAALSRLTGPSYGLADIIRAGRTSDRKKKLEGEESKVLSLLGCNPRLLVDAFESVADFVTESERMSLHGTSKR